MKFVLDVEGMMCQNSCGATVENALKAVPGVTGVIVSFPLHTATVLGDPELHEQDLIEAVEAVGFDAVPLSTLPPDVRLRVTGMMCQKSCGTTVETALGSVPGVILAVAEFGRSEARVWGTASVVDLMDAVDIVGFEAELLEGGASAGQKDEKPDLLIFVEDNEGNWLDDTGCMCIDVWGLMCDALLRRPAGGTGPRPHRRRHRQRGRSLLRAVQCGLEMRLSVRVS